MKPAHDTLVPSTLTGEPMPRAQLVTTAAININKDSSSQTSISAFQIPVCHFLSAVLYEKDHVILKP